MKTSNDLKYLTEEFGSKNLEHNFKRFNEERLPDKKCFYSPVKDGTTGDNGKKLNGHISQKKIVQKDLE